MAEALSPSKRELHQDHQEGTVKQFKADSPSALVTSESIQDKLEQVVSKLNEDRENDQIVIDGMKTSYEELCATQMESLNEKLQSAYKDSEDPVNERITLLNEKLETIRQLEADINQFKDKLGNLHNYITDN